MIQMTSVAPSDVELKEATATFEEAGQAQNQTLATEQAMIDTEDFQGASIALAVLHSKANTVKKPNMSTAGHE